MLYGWWQIESRHEKIKFYPFGVPNFVPCGPLTGTVNVGCITNYSDITSYQFHVAEAKS